MPKPDVGSYTPLDFLQWRASQSLVLAPKFQRRSLWQTPARSYLIDTIVRGMPVPPIYLRVAQHADKKRVIREVVDGQQRIAAVLDFMDDKYTLTKSIGAGLGGYGFNELGAKAQDAIREYAFTCHSFHGLSDAEVLEIFRRLNTYSIPLNPQELRNGRWFGLFKQLAYRLGFQYLEFWRNHRILTEQSIARMLEAELVSELLVAQLAGMQDKKKSLGAFYERYDEAFPEQEQVEKRFHAVMSNISDSLGDVLAQTAFRKAPLFYTVYCVVHARTFGLRGTNVATPTRPLNTIERGGLRDAVTRLSEVLATAAGGEHVEPKWTRFVAACARQTDNIRPRTDRFETLYAVAFP